MPYDRPMYDLNEKMDLDPNNYKAWVLGNQWYPPPWVPLFVDHHYCYGKYGMQYGPEVIFDPRTKGWDWRFWKGGFYLSVIQPTEEEGKKREPIWREKMRKILENPQAVWDKHKIPMRKEIDRIFASDLKGSTDIDLCDHWMETWHYGKKVEEAHFEPMYALGSGNITFRKLLKQLFNITSANIEYSQLHSGLDNEYTTIVDKLARIAALAADMGLKDTFKEPDAEKLLAKLASDKKGKEWLDKFDQMVHEVGYMRRRGLELATPTWWEDKTLPLKDIQRYVNEGKTTAGNLDMKPELVKRRKKLEQELLNKVPSSEREMFQKLLECSQASHIFSEEHTLYVEMMFFSALRTRALEFGRRFAAKGMIDDPGDTVFLHHEEIFHAGIIQERCDLRTLITRRKNEFAEYRKLEGTLPPVLGDPTKISELVDADVIFSVSVAPPIATPEEVGASLVGCAGAPGVVEGIACVVGGEEDLDKVIPGTILVAPATTASWTPVFNVIKGVVTDGGGYLTHALIVGREFGIPAVVGTQEATRKIKSGQRIRVDGNTCRVYILD
ncbi:MAG: hypothetical protein KG012_18085 [Deltaproteobacteria bacterium]|nr:hypothetical protein [Deltaproteobacteria bacterium]